MDCSDFRATGPAYNNGSDTGNGTISVPAGFKLNQASITSDGSTAATIQIAGKSVTTVPLNKTFSEVPADGHKIVGPFDVIYTDAESVFVSWVAV